METNKLNNNVLRFRATQVMFALSTCILATVILVNLAINRLEGNTIKLSSTISELEPLCEQYHNKTEHKIETIHEEHYKIVDKHFPPATSYAVLVWVDDEAIAKTTHATIQQINQRLATDVEVNNNNNGSLSAVHKAKIIHTEKAKEQRMIHRIVQWREEELITFFNLPSSFTENTDDSGNNVNNTKHSTDHLETLSEESNTLREEMLRIAEIEQVGLPTFEHVFAPQPGTQMHLITISFFTVKTDANESHHTYRDGNKSSNNMVDCYKFDDRQYICKYTKRKELEEKEKTSAAQHAPVTFDVHTQNDSNSRSSESIHGKTTTTNKRSDSHISKEEQQSEKKQTQEPITVASNDNINRPTLKTNVVQPLQDTLSSIIAQELEITSFHANHVKEWHTLREGHGCEYALNALKTLETSLHTHPNMIVPQSVQKTLVHVLEHSVHDAAECKSHSFVAIAQLAHALQFHLLLTPQLYIPWDHALVSQFTITQPLIVIWLLCIRFMIAARKRLKQEQHQEQQKQTGQESQNQQQEEKHDATTASEIHENNKNSDTTSLLRSKNDLEKCNKDDDKCTTDDETEGTLNTL